MALGDQLLPTIKVLNGMSMNRKMDSPLGSVQSNIIFNGTDTLPKEVMLETTLNAFNYNYDIFEVCFSTVNMLHVVKNPQTRSVEISPL